jgi:NDP-hexose-3-ketoreductase
MKTLLIGYSDIARRRVIPGLRAAGVEQLDLASVSATNAEWSGGEPPRRFRNYSEALAESNAALVYISTVNSLHAELAERALEQGFHVVVDKPAFPGFSETKRLVDLAKRKQLCLAEATVYSYHPRIAKILQIFEEAKCEPSHIVAAFSFPPHRPDNFRYNAALGGGAIWDLGPYAVSPGRVFFRESPLEIVSRCISRRGEVDTGFSILATYPDDRCAVGCFGYTTEYVNRLDVIGPGVTVTMDRAFSPLPNVPTELTIRRANQVTTMPIPPADTFALFLVDVFGSIARGDYSDFGDTMLADAYEMDRLRSSAANTGKWERSGT